MFHFRTTILLIILGPLAALLWMMSIVNRPETTPDSGDQQVWPVTNEEGLYMPYKQRGRWMNFWSRDRPSMLDFFLKIDHIRDANRDGVPSDVSKLNKTFPVVEPYWLNDSHQESREAGTPGIRMTWIGHATVLMEVDGTLVLTDPIFSERASYVQWMGIKRYRPPACTIKELPSNLHAVLISHDHYDHLDYESVKALNRRFGSDLQWFVPLGIGKWLRDNLGIEGKVHEMTWWTDLEIEGTDVKVVMTPSNHNCRRGLFDADKALWGSFAVIGPNNRAWFAGDTAYADVFSQIGNKYGPFDMAAIPIGAYHPWWFMKYFHVNPDQAVLLHRDVGSKLSLGIHWGTFRMTKEFYLEPRTKLAEALTKYGVDHKEFVAINIGETLEKK